MSHFSAFAIRFALDLGLKATLIFLATGAALVALRRASAATRHFVGTFGLATALLLPVLLLALPRIRVPLLPDLRPSAASSASLDDPGAREPAAPISRRMLALSVPEKSVLVPAADALAPASPAPPVPAAPANIPWRGLALGAWAAGFLAIAARLAVGWSRVSRIAREASPVGDAEWLDERDAAARRLALRRRVDLLESEEVSVAVTSGMRRPFLLLGRAARLWEVERRRIVLLHELAHVRRGDWAALLLAEAAVALYWFHPMAWWLGRRVRRDAETACDDLVIASGTKPSVYAGHLLGIFRALTTPAHPVGPALAIARPHHFEERLRAILDPRSAREGHAGPRGSLYAAALLAGAFAVAGVEPWKTQAQSPASADPAVAAAHKAGCTAVKCKKTSSAVQTKRVLSVVVSKDTVVEKDPVVDKIPANEDSVEPAPEALPETGRSLPAIWTASPGSRPEAAAGFVQASNGKRRSRDGSDWYDRGMELHNTERYTESVEAFEKAVEEGYREDAASYNAACGYARLGENDKAFEWLHRALDAGFDVAAYLGHDDDLDNLASDPRWAGIKKAARANKSSRERGKEQAAVTRYERLVARNPVSGEPFFDLGIELLRADRYDLAVKAYQASIDRGYRTGTAFYNQACGFSLAGDKEAALGALARALEAGFDQPQTLEKDDDLDAIRSDPRFTALEQQSRDLSLSTDGHGWWQKGSHSDRAKWRKTAARSAAYAKAHPESGRAWFNLGYASLAGDRPEDAVEAFRKAVELGHRKPTSMYNLACSYARLDQKDAAFDWLFKALDAGFDESGTLRGDDDLDNLRGDPRYRKALSIAKAKDREMENAKD